MNFQHPKLPRPGLGVQAAFTLVEVLVSMTVLIILLLISAQVIGTVQSTWTASNARVGQFREARTAFDIITRNLSQATLNTYIDYENNYLTTSGSTSAVTSGLARNSSTNKYLRKSDLRFVCGPAAQDLLPNGADVERSPGSAVFFQAPLGVAHDADFVGLDRLLCGRGYFVQYTSDDFFRPAILPAGVPRYRYRLMEFSPPAEKNTIYDTNDGTKSDWFRDAGVALENAGNEVPANRGLTRPIADNIVGLFIIPQVDTNAGGGNAQDAFESVIGYDSLDVGDGAGTGQGHQHRLPALVKVILVAIDERSADRLSQADSSGTPPFGGAISSALNSDDQAKNLNQALEKMGEVFRERNVNYRIFSATVAIRSAKWSS